MSRQFMESAGGAQSRGLKAWGWGFTRAGKLFVAVLLIAVLEGAFRKWVAEGLTMPLVLLRDVLALALVVHAVQIGALRFNRLAGVLLGGWTLTIIGWSLLQAVVSEMPIIIFVIGLRFWLLYVWFAAAAAVSITEQDFKMVCKTIGWLMILMAPLVVMQYLNPPTAFINKQVSNAEDDLIFVVMGDIVRTTGTFSFTLGFTVFLALVLPLALAELTAHKESAGGRWWSLVLATSAAIGLSVSGSRTAFGTVALLAPAYLAYLFVLNRVRMKLRTYVSVIAGMLLVGVVAISLSGALGALEERAEGAAQSEDLALRVTHTLTGSPEAWENFSVLGAGLGYSANFAGVALTGSRAFLQGEDESDRILGSAGLLGLVFMFLKAALLGAGLWLAVPNARNGNPLALLLWVSCSTALLGWPLTGQLTVNVLGPILVGLALMALRFPSVGGVR